MKTLSTLLTAVLVLSAVAAHAKRNININLDNAAAIRGPMIVPKGETRNGDIVVRGSVVIDGALNGDIAVIDGDVRVPGKVNGNIAALNSPVNVVGTVTGDIASAGGAVTVNGQVHGSVALMGGDLELGPKSQLNGDAALLGGRLKKLSGAKFDGNVSQLDLGVGRQLFNLATRMSGHGVEEKVIMVGDLVAICFYLGGWLLISLLAALLPRQVESVAVALRADPWKCAGIGLLVILAIVPGLILMVMSLIGIFLIPLAVLALGAAKLMAFAAFALILAVRVSESLGRPAPATLPGVAAGFLVMTCLLIAGKLLNLVGATTLGGLFVIVNFILISFGAVIGLGGVLTTRFGQRTI